MKRVILMILDSVGIGEMPDAKEYGDAGSHTLGNIAKQVGLNLPNLQAYGLGNIEDLEGILPQELPLAAYGKVAEASRGKDTVTGHWEIAGCISEVPLQTFPQGFPEEIMSAFEDKIGRGTLGNVVASGTEIIKELGEEHMKTGKPIIYTSADSVFQIAAHEEVIPLEELYKMCEIARDMLMGPWQVGRVIARPFVGTGADNFTRTANRHDYSLNPPCKTMLDYLSEAGQTVQGVGKIYDVFNGQGVTDTVKTKDNNQGLDETLAAMARVEEGLIFTNLVDFDMLYGHRNNAEGYRDALQAVDQRLPEIVNAMRPEDLLIITADHGCDPTTQSTDHSREYIPLLVIGKGIAPRNLGIRTAFTDIGKSILDYLGVDNDLAGKSFIPEVSL